MHAWHAVPSCKWNKIKTNSNEDMKNFLWALHRLFPSASANSPAKPAGSDTLSRTGLMQRSQRKFYNYPLIGVSFYFVPFTRRLRVPRMHILLWTNKHYVACADLHRVKKKRKELAIYATLDHIQKNCYTSITDGEKLKNSFIFPSLTTV